MADSGYALYLQSGERTISVTDATLDARWGAQARALETSTPFATEAAGNAEATRRIAFQGGPLTEHVATLAGKLNVSALRGRCITLDGVLSFVLGGDVDHDKAVTTLAVLRKPA